MLGLLGVIDMITGLCMPSLLITTFLVDLVAVAVRAMTFIPLGIKLRISPRRAYSSLKSSPLLEEQVHTL